MTEITASFDTLLNQASYTADKYLRNAVHYIDETLGEGYAAKHPQLIAAYMQVAGADFAATSTAKVLGEAIERLADTIHDVADAIERNS